MVLPYYYWLTVSKLQTRASPKILKFRTIEQVWRMTTTSLRKGWERGWNWKVRRKKWLDRTTERCYWNKKLAFFWKMIQTHSTYLQAPKHEWKWHHSRQLLTKHYHCNQRCILECSPSCALQLSCTRRGAFVFGTGTSTRGSVVMKVIINSKAAVADMAGLYASRSHNRWMDAEVGNV